MKFITKFLSHETIKDLEKEYNYIKFGEVEDLVDIPQKQEEVANLETIKKIVISDGDSEEKLKVKSILKDDFEFILICEKDNALKVYGAIEDFGAKYIYELEDDNQDYLKSIVDAAIGTKANIKAHYYSDKFIRKTFIKIDDEISDVYTMVIKTVDGINSKSFGGVHHTIKTEKVLDYKEPINNLQILTPDLNKNIEEEIYIEEVY